MNLLCLSQNNDLFRMINNDNLSFNHLQSGLLVQVFEVFRCL